jgi:hypothetical protein
MGGTPDELAARLKDSLNGTSRTDGLTDWLAAAPCSLQIRTIVFLAHAGDFLFSEDDLRPSSPLLPTRSRPRQKERAQPSCNRHSRS